MIHSNLLLRKPSLRHASVLEILDSFIPARRDGHAMHTMLCSDTVEQAADSGISKPLATGAFITPNLPVFDGHVGP